jgi:head-tail adaptor
LQKMRIRSLDDNSIHRILFADDPDRRRRQINIYANEGQSS